MSANLENPNMEDPGHRTGKSQPSFKFPRREALNNVQTMGQLHSFQMLVRSCSKSYKLGFRIT